MTSIIKERRDDILSYIKSQKWFFGVRAEEALFFYSAKYLNREKLIRKYYKSNFVETLLFPLKKYYPVRVFNLLQAKVFHQESLNKTKYNPAILAKFIELDNKNWQDIDLVIKKLTENIKLQKFNQSKALFLTLLKKYGLYGNFFFIIFSQGMVMTKNRDDFYKDISVILKKHDVWRNSVAFKEEKLGKAVYLFLKILVKQMNLGVSPHEIMKYLTAEEVLAILAAKLSDKEIGRIIASRKKYGYIYTYLREKKFQGVIDNSKIINQINEYFFNILEMENTKSGSLKGMSAFNVPKKIRAKVAVIEDKHKLVRNKTSLAGKILVAIQTTPHFIPYIKKVKGIVTDEGGITCHAAIISREFKIPCIVGTKNATRILKNGDLVELDTQEGIIMKI
jgi:phosphohistidine swiveling domain-containing protein